MKTEIGLMGLIGLTTFGTAAWAADTNRITFTNGTSVVMGAIPVRVEKSKLIYRYEGGGGGMVKLSELPRDLQDRFHYDERQAAADADDEQRKKERRLKAAQAIAEGESARADHLEKVKLAYQSMMMLWGRVIERKDKEGLFIVDADSHGDFDNAKVEEAMENERREYLEELGKPLTTPREKQHLESAKGTVCVSGGWYLRLVVGDRVALPVYPIGEYMYYTDHPIRKFTFRLEEATR